LNFVFVVSFLSVRSKKVHPDSETELHYSLSNDQLDENSLDEKDYYQYNFQTIPEDTFFVEANVHE
jgi:hypothetical protein